MQKKNITEKGVLPQILPTKSLAQLSLVTLFSRIFGQIRVTLWASLLATSEYADSFYLALKLPNMLRAYFAEGAMNSVFVLFYTDLLQKDAHQRRAFIKRLVLFLFLLLGLLTFLVLLTAPLIARFYYIFFAKSNQNTLFFLDYTAKLISIAFPYLFFISFVALMGGVLQSWGIFRPVGASPVVFNIVNIVFLLVFLFFYRESLGSGEEMPFYLTYIFIFAGFVQFLYMVWSLRLLKNRKIEEIAPQPKKSEKEEKKTAKKEKNTLSLRQFFVKLSPVTLASVIHHVNIFLIDPIALSLGSGAIAALFYSNRLLELPMGLLVFPISTIVLPNILRILRQNKSEEVGNNLHYAYALMLLFLLPVLVSVVYYREKIVFIVFRFGSFSSEDVKIVAQTFFFHAFSIPFLGIYRLTTTVFYAHKCIKIVFVSALISLVFSLSLAFGLTQFFPFVWVIALSSSLAIFFSSVFLLWSLKKTLNISLFFPLIKKTLMYSFLMIPPFFLAELMARILRLGIGAAMKFVENIWWQKILLLGEFVFFFGFFFLFYLLLLRVLGDSVLDHFIFSLQDRKDGSVKDSR